MPTRESGAEDRDGDVALTRLDFPDYAALWQEQTSPEELALLQARAKTIGRSSRRRGLRDFAITLLPLGLIGTFLVLHATSLPVMLGLVSILAVVIWLAWRRHLITRAAMAIAVDHPRAFFETAIENARAELRLSTIALAGGVPALVATLWLLKANDGIDFGAWVARLPRDINLFVATVLTIFVLAFAYFLRENFMLRRQLRGLEAMRREWEDERPGR